jgi:broad specificity phosphatase PhoE
METSCLLYLVPDCASTLEHSSKPLGRQLNPGLSEKGHQQARRLGERLSSRNFSAIYSSPQLRAIQTASYLAGHYGAEVKLQTRLNAADQEEPFLATQDRICTWVRDIAARHDNGRVVSVTHPEVIRATVAGLCNLSAEDASELEFQRGGFCVFRIYGDTISLESIVHPDEELVAA